MAYTTLKCVAFIIGCLPPRLLKAGALVLAVLAFDLLRVRRRLILANLARALPDAHEHEHVRIGRQSVYHFFLTVFEFFYWQSHPESLQYQFVDAEKIQCLLDQGTGVFAAATHLGNWEALGIVFSRALVPSYVAVKKVGSDNVNRYVSERRANMGFLAIDRTGVGAGYRAMRRTLKAGHIVGFILDQARPGEPRLPFFGESAKTNTTLAGIWMRNPSPIIPAYIIREDFNVHRVGVLDEFVFEPTGDKDQDVLAMSAALNREVEKVILLAPEQYFWMHNRWK